MEDVLRFLFSFQGRLSRRDLWLRYALPYFGALLLLTLIGYSANGYDIQKDDLWFRIIAVAVLVSLWPSLAVLARRCHDRGRSAWWNVLLLVPYLNFLYSLELHLVPGVVGANEYGPDPLDAQYNVPSPILDRRRPPADRLIGGA